MLSVFSLFPKKRPNLTSPHLTSPHLTSPSPHLTSPNLTSPNLTSRYQHPLPQVIENPRLTKNVQRRISIFSSVYQPHTHDAISQQFSNWNLEHFWTPGFCLCWLKIPRCTQVENPGKRVTCSFPKWGSMMSQKIDFMIFV